MLVELDRVGFTAGGTIRFMLENALAATAAAWASGLNPALIVRALTTFRTDMKTTPGRFNLFGLAERQVILDYGHNVGAIKALGEALPRTEGRRTIMAIGLPGDRRDEDLLATFQATLPFVDEYVLYDLKDRRGRAELEVPQMMRSCLAPGTPYHFAADQREAILRAFQHTRPGDRMVVIADIVDEALEVLEVLAEADEDASCENPVERAFE
jgi:cyanophycin synthetase